MISNLVNRATVLLNYPIGDLAAWAVASCPCGRSLRLLDELEGRVEDVLALDDGSFVHPRAVWQIFKDDRDVLQYQLTQHEPRRFVLRLTTQDETAYARAVARGLAALESLLGPGPAIAAERSGELRAARRQVPRGRLPAAGAAAKPHQLREEQKRIRRRPQCLDACGRARRGARSCDAKIRFLPHKKTACGTSTSRFNQRRGQLLRARTRIRLPRRHGDPPHASAPVTRPAPLGRPP